MNINNMIVYDISDGNNTVELNMLEDYKDAEKANKLTNYDTSKFTQNYENLLWVLIGPEIVKININDKTKYLSGAEFKLVKENGAKKEIYGASGTNGIIEWYEDRANTKRKDLYTIGEQYSGTCILTEMKAPTGNALSGVHWKIILPGTRTDGSECIVSAKLINDENSFIPIEGFKEFNAQTITKKNGQTLTLKIPILRLEYGIPCSTNCPAQAAWGFTGIQQGEWR